MGWVEAVGKDCIIKVRSESRVSGDKKQPSLINMNGITLKQVEIMGVCQEHS